MFIYIQKIFFSRLKTQKRWGELGGRAIWQAGGTERFYMNCCVYFKGFS